MLLAPDAAIPLGIRRLLRSRLRSELAAAPVDPHQRIAEMRRQFAKGPVAECTDDSRRQHYEAPTELFAAMLGPQLKYSSCLWDDGVASLEAAEEAMLRLTAERAQLADGQRILDLGCGWGSFALWAAQRYPHSDIVAASHSRTQHEYITAQARRRGLSNVRHVVADVAAADFPARLARLAPAGAGDGDERGFDRIVSIEMFEHLRNVERLLHLLGDWIAPGGRLLVHIFCHRRLFYRYRDDGPGDWMARHFFTGGAMPPPERSGHVLGPFQRLIRGEMQGLHYGRPCRHWLQRLTQRRGIVLDRLQQDLPPPEARRQWQRWRMFVMACEELFAYDAGRQWLVSHHLLAPR